MSEPRLSDMSEAEFEALIEGHIERTANSDYELPADVIIDLLLVRREACKKGHNEGSQTNNTVCAPVTLIAAGDAPGGRHDNTYH